MILFPVQETETQKTYGNLPKLVSDQPRLEPRRLCYDA